MNKSKTTWNEDLAELLGLSPKDIEAAKKADAEENARRQKEQKLLDVIIHNEGCLTRAEKEAALGKLRTAFRDRVEAVNCKACGKPFKRTILAPADYDGWHYALATPFGHGNVCIVDVSGIDDSGIPNIAIASILDADRRLLASFAIAL